MGWLFPEYFYNWKKIVGFIYLNQSETAKPFLRGPILPSSKASLYQHCSVVQLQLCSELWIKMAETNQFVDFDSFTPIMVICPSCKEIGPTKVRSRPGIGAWLAATFLCAIGCWCGCCLIPFGMVSFREHKHYCRFCNAYLGKGHGGGTIWCCVKTTEDQMSNYSNLVLFATFLDTLK